MVRGDQQGYLQERRTLTAVDSRGEGADESARSFAMDAFRGVVVTAMIVVHTTRVVPPSADESDFRDFRAYASLFEPAVSVAFLWLVGWSLERAYARTSHSGTNWRSWYGSALARAATLYGLGVLLFVLQYGVVLPDVWASPDVLATIAWVIVVLGALLPLGLRGLIGGAVASVALTVLSERLVFYASGVNAGPGAVLPLLCIGCVGACHRATAGHRSASNLCWAALGCVAGIVALVLPGELLDLQRVADAGTQELWFWNHTTKGIVVYGGGIALAAAVFARSRCASKLWAPLRLLGRHALVTYVGHLLVLGGLDRWLGLPPGRSSLVIVVLGLGALFAGIAMALESTLGGHVRQAVRQHLGLRL